MKRRSAAGGWDKLKKMLGFGKKCENGGHKNNTGDCVCPKDFSGQHCEWIVCYNGGVNVTSSDCDCSNPSRYSGSHCQTTKCDNGGKDNGNGSCSCASGWYSGKYCEVYGSSWLIMFGVAGVILILLVTCCLVYRLGCRCKRSRNNTPRNSRDASPSQRRRQGGRSNRDRDDDEVSNYLANTGSTRLQYRESKPPAYRPETPPPSYELALSWSQENLDRVGLAEEEGNVSAEEGNVSAEVEIDSNTTQSRQTQL